MKIYLKIFSFFFCLLCSHFSVAQTQNSDFTINHIAVKFESDKTIWLAKNINAKAQKSILVLMQSERILTDVDIQSLSAAAIFIQEFVGQNVYVARVSGNSNFAACTMISAFANSEPEYKIAKSIQQKLKAKKNIECLVSFYNDVSVSEIQTIIQKSGASILPNRWQQKGLYKIQIEVSKLIELAAHFGVKYIGEVNQNIPLDLDSKGAQGAILSSLPIAKGGKNLTGKDVFIGHGDNCSGIFHIDQSDRVINYNNGDLSNHGVIVNGLMAGDGIVNPAGQGIATNGTCISLFFDAVLLLKDELYKGFNTTLTNNSYAVKVGDCAYSGTYDELSINLDKMAFELPNQLDVFAAGNDGRLVCGGYPYGYYNICGGFQTAKNIISVGATSRDLVVGDGSSRGPIQDGRLKPDMVANGIDVLCPTNPNAYVIDRGTSFACPQVTGVLALLTERYKQLFAANPRADLLKAITLNGASDLGNPGPDFKYGFGFLNLTRSLAILENNRFKRNIISSGAAAQTFTINVPANTAQLKVMLYYHDPAAAASASTQLVNDLDLSVTEPMGGVHLPLILNTTPAGVGNNASEGLDRKNNAEQVTLNNPSAGIYTISVANFSIPKGPQEYVVAYDFVPDSLRLLFPIANTAAASNTDMYIYWDAPADDSNPTLVEYSINGGSSWASLATVAANTRFYKWAVPTINSNQCKIRISRASKIEESGNFTINEQTVASLAATQCPGSISVNWSAVPAATKYKMLLKRGLHLEIIDSVNAGVLNYKFTGLSTNENYFVAVLPVFGSTEGYRSIAINAIPNTGTCTSAIDGDLSLGAILAPNTGRRFTKSALQSNSELKIKVRNQDDNAVANFSVAYQINSSIWKSIPSFTIGANTSQDFVVDTLDLTDTLLYTIKVVVINMDRPDPIASNDTLIKIVKHYPNDTLNLIDDLVLDFENMNDLTLLKDTTGLSLDGFWDFENTNDTGRLRSRIPGSKLVKTTRSISMDVNVNCKSNVNFLTGTFNLSAYDTSADEIRLDFEYEMRGMPILRDSNKVWVRGNDTANWIEIFQYSNLLDTAKLHQSGTLSLRQILLNDHQNFSASTQIRFGQYDTTVIVEDNYGGGLTIDNVHLYKISKDLQLSRVIAPMKSDCAITNSPVTIVIKNGTVNTVKDISMGYIFDSNPAEFQNITDSLSGVDSLNFTFIQNLADITIGYHSLKVWVHTSGDDYSKNDTINFVFYNAQQINSFPYLENFETSEGNWYATGRNSSWAYGTPNSSIINKAASGTKIWKTNLNGNYNDNELSYLNSPCINTAVIAQPMLSFSIAFDIEKCVVVCDRVVVEYSTDNEATWKRLGNVGEGTNWYNNEVHNVWNGTATRWHVASIPLPRASSMKLRFAMSSDMGANYEGIAVDDIHIFDLKNKITALNLGEQKNSNAINISDSIFQPLLYETSEIIAAINPQNQIQSNVLATIFQHENIIDSVARQYVMPRSFVFSSDNINSTNLLLRLFISDNEVNKVLNDNNSLQSSKPIDIYRAGISQFANADKKLNDRSLNNNGNSLQTFYPYSAVKWVPYDNGYYAEFAANNLGEFWINDGGITGALVANTEYIHLTAQKTSDTKAQLNWTCIIDTAMNKYELQRSTDSIDFTTVSTVSSENKIGYNYLSIDEPKLDIEAEIYYRLLCIAKNNKTFFSNIASVEWTKGNQLLAVYPNPFFNGNLFLKWTASIGSSAMVQMKDILGRKVFEQNLIATSWTNTSILSLPFLSKGVYFFSIQIGNELYVKKLIGR